MSQKDKKLSFHNNQLLNHNRDIERAKRITKLPFTMIHIYNASSEKEELMIPPDLKEGLQRFIINYFESEKIKEYEGIKDALKLDD